MPDGPGNFAFPRSRLQARTSANLARSIQAGRDIVSNPKPSILRLFAWPMARFPEAERRRLHKMICMQYSPRSPTLGLEDQHLLAFGRS